VLISLLFSSGQSPTSDHKLLSPKQNTTFLTYVR